MNRRPIKRLIDDDIKKAKVLTPKEFKKLLFVVGLTRNPERNTLIIYLLFAAGFRVTEVACIQIKDVIWPNGKLKIETRIPAKFTKNGEAGHVFFYSKKLQVALNAYLDKRVSKKQWLDDPNKYRGLHPDSPVILSESGTGYSLKKKYRKNQDKKTIEYWAADTLQDLITKWGKEGGITGMTSHSKCIPVNSYIEDVALDVRAKIPYRYSVFSSAQIF